MIHLFDFGTLTTDEVVQAGAVIISALLGVIGVMLGIVLHGQRSSRLTNKATLHQVKNSHDINLRDDMDEKQDESRDLLKQVRDDVNMTRVDLRDIRQTQHDDREETRSRFAELERTRPPTRKKTI